jgi:hypothetical protein
MAGCRDDGRERQGNEGRHKGFERRRGKVRGIVSVLPWKPLKEQATLRLGYRASEDG